MRIILPRAIYGNRGDLASRWGVLHALKELGATDVLTFEKLAGDTPDLGFETFPYGKARNLLLSLRIWKKFKPGSLVLWAVGLDLQDDSSLLKLAYLWFTWLLYRLLGLKMVCLYQGAGPIKTPTGKWLAKQALSKVDLFIARDPGTLRLVNAIAPKIETRLAHDAIFLPGFEQDIANLTGTAREKVDMRIGTDQSHPVIGINIRQWFHFTSSLLPYQMNQEAYRSQAGEKMEALIKAMVKFVGELRNTLDARIMLISAYQPGVQSWEDDLPWLQKIKQAFLEDENVVLTDQPFSMPEYYYLISRLDLMVGMRLHSTLIALRMGVPSINISYTLKGGDILGHMGLQENVVDLQEFISGPGKAFEKVQDIISRIQEEQEKVHGCVMNSIQENMKILSNIIDERQHE